MDKDFEEQLIAQLGSDEFKIAVKDRMSLMDAEEETKEEAPWIGKTGLPEDWERELPRYLRRELGESLFDEGALKAKDLVYIGAYTENGGVTHFWKVPFKSEDHVFAYIEDFDGGCFGWGDKAPE